MFLTHPQRIVRSNHSRIQKNFYRVHRHQQNYERGPWAKVVWKPLPKKKTLLIHYSKKFTGFKNIEHTPFFHFENSSTTLRILRNVQFFSSISKLSLHQFISEKYSFISRNIHDVKKIFCKFH